MKKVILKRIILMTFGTLLMMSCNSQPTGSLICLSYSYSNSSANLGIGCEKLPEGSDYRAELNKNDSVNITIDIYSASTSQEIVADKTVMADLLEIVNRFGMNEYSGNYSPLKEPNGGTHWGFFLKYSDGSTIDADGYIKYPPNAVNAFAAIEGYFEKWRVKLWEGNFKSDIDKDGNNQIEGAGAVCYTMKVDTIKDNNYHIVFKAEGFHTHHELECRGERKNGQVEIFYVKKLDGDFNDSAIDKSKPLFELSKNNEHFKLYCEQYSCFDNENEIPLLKE